MAESVGATVVHVASEWDAQWTLAAVADALRAHKPTLVTAVHCETPTGVLRTHLDQVGAAIREHAPDALFYVDCVSSAGGAPVDVDKWHIDLALVGSQKALSCPPNLSVVAVSERAWKRIDDVAYQGYDALQPWKSVASDGALPPYTFDWHSLAALDVALQLLLDEGVENAIARHSAVAAHTRAELAKLGLKTYARAKENASPTVTAFYVPDGWTWAEFDRELRANGLVLTNSFGKVADTLCRIGHMGSQANEEMVDQALAIIAKTLQSKKAK